MPFTPPKSWTIGETLTSDDLNEQVSDNLDWLANRPSFFVRRTANQSIPDSSFTQVEFTAADLWDSHGFHDPSSDPELITVPAGADGIYTFHWGLTFATNSTGQRLGTIGSGSGFYYGGSEAVTGLETVLCLSEMTYRVAGQSIFLYAYQSSGSPLNVTDAWLAGVWEGVI